MRWNRKGETKMKKAKIRRKKAAILVIDIQEKLLPAIDQKDEIVRRASTLINGGNILDIPILVTEQYPKGLGKTVPEIEELLGDFQPIEKTVFSVLGEPNFVEALKELKCEDIIICGIEEIGRAHV